MFIRILGFQIIQLLLQKVHNWFDFTNIKVICYDYFHMYFKIATQLVWIFAPKIGYALGACRCAAIVVRWFDMMKRLAFHFLARVNWNNIEIKLLADSPDSVRERPEATLEKSSFSPFLKLGVAQQLHHFLWDLLTGILLNVTYVMKNAIFFVRNQILLI